MVGVVDGDFDPVVVGVVVLDVVLDPVAVRVFVPVF